MTPAKQTNFRRIVTQMVNGKAVVESDGPIERCEFASIPGYFHSLIWVNPTTPDLKNRQKFGEIWLELDDNRTVHLQKGDVVVQNGTRHA